MRSPDLIIDGLTSTVHPSALGIFLGRPLLGISAQTCSCQPERIRQRNPVLAHQRCSTKIHLHLHFSNGYQSLLLDNTLK